VVLAPKRSSLRTPSYTDRILTHSLPGTWQKKKKDKETEGNGGGGSWMKPQVLVALSSSASYCLMSGRAFPNFLYFLHLTLAYPSSFPSLQARITVSVGVITTWPTTSP